jgi:hypothetical protein
MNENYLKIVNFTIWKKHIKMPTVLRIGPYRFHFYSDELNEPAHIHVATSDGECKFWLDPIKIARNMNLKPPDLRKIERLVFENRNFLIAKYLEYNVH